MPATYEPIATTTLGSAASSITFSSIPGTYTDLRLVFTYYVDTGSLYSTVRFNSDSGSNYSYTQIFGNGSSASSGSSTNNSNTWLSTGDTISTSLMGMGTMDIFSYAGSTNKTVLVTGSYDKNGSGVTGRLVSLWRSTSAITSITIGLSGSGNYVAGSTATLYGILKA
jgi:hypothetical protein